MAEQKGRAPGGSEAARFRPLFARWARRVRNRLAFREALTGFALALAVSVVLAGIAWKTRHGDLRPYAAGLGAVGIGLGLVSARRKRWSDTDVALFLDERLSTEEAIATAVESTSESREQGDAARAVVITTAASALAGGDPKRVRPPLWKPVHALVPFAILALVGVARAPLPVAPVSAAPPGTAKVQIAQVEGLKKIAKVGQLTARDEAQRERLDKIAKDAEKLKEELAKGMEKREAQDKIARLREAISEERLSLGQGEQRAGLESAVSKLEESDVTKRAAKALGDHDLESVDQEMERIANEREKADREIAKKKLDEASDAAKKNGAKDVAKALEDQKKGIEKREKRATALRDLADAMKETGESGGSLKSESEALDREKSDAAAKKLADSMGKALEKLTPEERKRLAEKLKEMSKGKGTSQGDADQMKDLADDLSTPEGQKKLEDQLKEMAKDDAESEESKRQKGLDDAEDGANGTEGDIGKQGEQGQQGQGQQGQQGQGQQGQGQQGQGQQGQGQQGQGQQGQGQQGQGQQGQGQQGQQGQGGIPMPGQGQGQQGQGQGGQNSGNGNGGHGSHDQGSGDHKGSTGPIDAHTLKSRARGPMNKGEAMPGSVTTFVPGKAGGTANTRGTGDLRVVGPSEVDGVERSDVPEEYREHVRQYFQP